MMGFVHIMIILTDAVIITCLLSCTKKSEKYPASPDRRDQFVGTYKVIDSNPAFEFEISKVDSTDGKQYLHIKNFANLFDMTIKISQFDVPSTVIPFPSYFPILDKYDNRWSFAVYENDAVYNNYKLSNDTLRVYFRLRNMNWYVEDDTIGIDKYYLQTGVKQQ